MAIWVWFLMQYMQLNQNLSYIFTLIFLTAKLISPQRYYLSSPNQPLFTSSGNICKCLYLGRLFQTKLYMQMMQCNIDCIQWQKRPCGWLLAFNAFSICVFMFISKSHCNVSLYIHISMPLISEESETGWEKKWITPFLNNYFCCFPWILI